MSEVIAPGRHRRQPRPVGAEIEFGTVSRGLSSSRELVGEVKFSRALHALSSSLDTIM